MGTKKSFHRNPRDSRTDLQKLVDNIAKGTSEDPSKLAVKRLYDSFFDLQKAVINDQDHYKVICCSRRAGKTELLARWLLHTALSYPNSEVLYIAQSSKSARELLWSNPKTGLPSLISALDLEDYAETNETKAWVKLYNGSIIYLSGAETKGDVSKWLGHQFKLVLVDEAQELTDEVLNYLTRIVVIPALKDNSGTIALAGTPKDSCSGLFYDAATGGTNAWSKHHWTIWENPYMPDAKHLIEEELRKFCESMSDPGPRRRYNGEWIHEDRVQLYQYAPDRNDYTILPTKDEQNRSIAWNYVCGMDIGFRDLTTLTVVAWSKQLPVAYVIDTVGKAGMLDDELNTHLKALRQKYPKLQVVADTGALGLRIIENYQHVYGEYIQRADKKEKAATISLLNTRFRRGEVKINKFTCAPLINELLRCEVDRETQIERKTDRCDYADGFLYAWRLTNTHLYKARPISLSAAEQWKVKARDSETAACEELNKSEYEKMFEEQRKYHDAQQRMFKNFF